MAQSPSHPGLHNGSGFPQPVQSACTPSWSAAASSWQTEINDAEGSTSSPSRGFPRMDSHGMRVPNSDVPPGSGVAAGGSGYPCTKDSHLSALDARLQSVEAHFMLFQQDQHRGHHLLQQQLRNLQMTVDLLSGRGDGPPVVQIPESVPAPAATPTASLRPATPNPWAAGTPRTSAMVSCGTQTSSAPPRAEGPSRAEGSLERPPAAPRPNAHSGSAQAPGSRRLEGTEASASDINLTIRLVVEHAVPATNGAATATVAPVAAPTPPAAGAPADALANTLLLQALRPIVRRHRESSTDRPSSSSTRRSSRSADRDSGARTSSQPPPAASTRTGGSPEMSPRQAGAGSSRSFSQNRASGSSRSSSRSPRVHSTVAEALSLDLSALSSARRESARAPGPDDAAHSAPQPPGNREDNRDPAVGLSSGATLLRLNQLLTSFLDPLGVTTFLGAAGGPAADGTTGGPTDGGAVGSPAGGGAAGAVSEGAAPSLGVILLAEEGDGVGSLLGGPTDMLDPLGRIGGVMGQRGGSADPPWGRIGGLMGQRGGTIDLP
ncbi:hypothetical protein CYMTET_10569 [Cymbomonas tetramitiformis]|uniref:Uncharacterized protein n=1 Tax=Cymbomonas tetramitiformis TaxID=36881 RepID=A0AAE0GPG8_9CHLO|nr:hypothetical protein CYMTET_10569 [Cymbomonas tetramitiformis]